MEESNQPQDNENNKRNLDLLKVQEIVKRMQKKYADEGVQEGTENNQGCVNLQRAVQGEKTTQVEVQKVEELKDSDNKLVRFFGNLFFSLQSITQPLSKVLQNMRLVKRIAMDLSAANMKYSVAQWTALSVGAALASLLFGLLLGIVLFLFGKLPAAAVLLIGLLLFLLAFVVMLLIPKRRAFSRAASIERELPFALRHMATELRAGIGFYRTLQTVAAADYGFLSEEISRTIVEIEEGTETKVALQNLADRSYCKSLKGAVKNMARALKTGGNLSDAMDEIASEVSFDLRTQLQTFSSKMNFFGVIFIFIAIVLPVFVSILGAIRNTPLQAGGLISFDVIPLTVDVIAIIYLVFMPILLLGIFLYITAIQPKT